VVDGLTTDIRRRDVERACIEEKQRLLRDIEVAEDQLAAGQGIPHEYCQLSDIRIRELDFGQHRHQLGSTRCR
jgi:hypothetical protein